MSKIEYDTEPYRLMINELMPRLVKLGTLYCIDALIIFHPTSSKLALEVKRNKDGMEDSSRRTTKVFIGLNDTGQIKIFKMIPKTNYGAASQNDYEEHICSTIDLADPKSLENNTFEFFVLAALV